MLLTSSGSCLSSCDASYNAGGRECSGWQFALVPKRKRERIRRYSDARTLVALIILPARYSDRHVQLLASKRAFVKCTSRTQHLRHKR